MRAGDRGDAEQFCLERSYCGIGWAEIGDLSVLSDEDLEREVDVVWGSEGNGVTRQYKSVLKEFKRIRQGDMPVWRL